MKTIDNIKTRDDKKISVKYAINSARLFSNRYNWIIENYETEIEFLKKEINEKLRNLGFELYNIDDNSRSLVIHSNKEIIEKCKDQWTNLLCKRKR